jgi:hypothetical protein
MSAVIALGCLLAIASGASASSLRMSSQPAEPPPLVAKQGDAVVSASLGDYEWGGVISDAGYPLPIHKRLRVSPGDRVSLRFGAPAARVAVTLLHVTAEEPIHHEAGDVLAHLGSRPLSPGRGHWVTKLPRDLKSGNVLDVSVLYANGRGGADFWVGLRAKPAGANGRAAKGTSVVGGSCVVPDLIGTKLRLASKRLRGAGCRLGKVKVNESINLLTDAAILG